MSGADTGIPWVQASVEATTVAIPSGSFRMGATGPGTRPEDGEGPVRDVRLSAFEIATGPVTNAEFSRFIEETRYVTDAETYGWSFVFGALAVSPRRPRET